MSPPAAQRRNSLDPIGLKSSSNQKKRASTDGGDPFLAQKEGFELFEGKIASEYAVNGGKISSNKSAESAPFRPQKFNAVKWQKMPSDGFGVSVGV